MVTKIQKWGNSLGVRIPKSFAREAGITEGTLVDISPEGGRPWIGLCLTNGTGFGSFSAGD